MTKSRVTSTASSAAGTGPGTTGPRISKHSSDKEIQQALTVGLKKWVPIFQLKDWSFHVAKPFNHDETHLVMACNAAVGVKTCEITAARGYDYPEPQDGFELSLRHELVHVVLNEMGLAPALENGLDEKMAKVVHEMVESLCDKIAMIVGEAYDAGRTSKG